MAIEKVELSGTLNADEMLPVASTPAGQNRSASDAEQNQPRRREPASEKDSFEPPAEGEDKYTEKYRDKDDDRDQDHQDKDGKAGKDQDENKHKDKDSGETDRPPRRIDSLA
jgi:hypothetical protein